MLSGFSFSFQRSSSSEAAFREGDYVITCCSTSRDFPQTGIGLIKGASADTLEGDRFGSIHSAGADYPQAEADGEYRLYKGMLDTVLSTTGLIFTMHFRFPDGPGFPIWFITAYTGVRQTSRAVMRIWCF